MISVIIINYNGMKFADKLIESILSQTAVYGEVIITDNSSSDESAEYLFSRLKYAVLLKFKENIGFASAVNKAVKSASFENILLLNNDTYLKEDFIELACKNLNCRNKIFYAPLVLNYEGTFIDSAGDYMGKGFKPMKRLSGEKYTGKLSPAKVDAFSMSATYFKKSEFISLGMLDERFFMYFEDADFSLRAKEMGYEILFTPECIAYHFISGSTKSVYKNIYSPKKVFWESRNRVWMFLKTKYRINPIKSAEFSYGTMTSFIYHLLKTGYPIEYLTGFFEAFRKGRNR
jgi:hypothetical protein